MLYCRLGPAARLPDPRRDQAATVGPRRPTCLTMLGLSILNATHSLPPLHAPVSSWS
jgi:hypothetical protein